MEPPAERRDNILGQRIEERRRNVEALHRLAEDPGRRAASDRPQFRNRLVALGDDDRFAGLHALDERRKVGLEFADVDFRHCDYIIDHKSGSFKNRGAGLCS